MKDTGGQVILSPQGSIAFIHDDLPGLDVWREWLLDMEPKERRKHKKMARECGYRVEPVVIVSKARYEALLTCERIVHGRTIEMVEERGAEGETKEAACG